MDEYKNLANGIIEQACKDYMWSIRYIEKHDHPEVTLTSALEQILQKQRFSNVIVRTSSEAGILCCCLELTVKKSLNT